MILLKIYEEDHCILRKIDWYPCVIGRSMHVDISVGHLSVSGRHAAIEAFEDHFIIRDLGSFNGLFHNGVKVESVALKKNETIWIGDVKVEVIFDEHLPKTSPGRALGESPSHAGLRGWVLSFVILFVGYLGACILVIYQAYGRVWPPEAIYPLFGKSFLLWGSGAAIAGLFALFSKLNVQKFHFRTIATLVFVFGFLSYLVLLTLNSIVFNLRGLPGAGFLDVAFFFFLALTFANTLMRFLLANVSSRVRIFVSTILATSAVFLMRWVKPDRDDGSGRTLVTALGVSIVDPAIAIDADSEDMRGFFFRTIAEVDGDRGKTLERRGRALVEPKWDSNRNDVEDLDDDQSGEDQ
jgi:hypothetical protein